MKIRAFITHKKAEQFKDCQDRFSINIDTKSAAVSDGMSQSYQQKIWADLLVKAYTKNTLWVPNLESVRELVPQWIESVKSFIQNLKDTHAPQSLIIRNENALALRKSAGATLCGIRFNENKWNGHVLGDSCLIEITNGKIQNFYTSQKGDEFDNYPDYFDSNPLSDGKGTPLAIKGTLCKSTSIIIVSDPFSDFLLEKRKDGNEEDYIKQLFNINNHDDFEKLVEDWRNHLNMHNDDTTLIIIEDDNCSNFNIDWCDNIEEFITREDAGPNTPSRDNSNICNGSNRFKPNSSFETINEEPSGTIHKDLFSIKKISKDEFVLTGIERYELIKAKSEVGFMSVEKDDIDILKETFREVYELYSNNFNE